MTSDDQEASSEVAEVVDRVDTAAAVQIAAASKKKTRQNGEVKEESEFQEISDYKEPEKTGNSNRNFPRIFS